MKKIIFMLLLFPLIARAGTLSDNVSGNVVKPPNPTTGTSDNSCYEYGVAYYIGFTQGPYKLQGLRVSFYDEKGEKIGDTIDEFSYGSLFAQKYDSIVGTTFSTSYIQKTLDVLNKLDLEFDKLKKLDKAKFTAAEIKGVADVGNKMSNDVITKNYKNTTLKNFGSNKTLKYLTNTIIPEHDKLKKTMEFLKAKASVAEANDFSIRAINREFSIGQKTKVEYQKIKEKLSSKSDVKKYFEDGIYMYYFDEVANAGLMDNKTCPKATMNKTAGTSTSSSVCYYTINADKPHVFGALFYTSQPSSKEPLAKYFTTPEVVQRYINIAEATKLANIEEGNYTLIIEPIFSLSSARCDNSGNHIGFYTTADIGALTTIVPNLVQPNDNARRMPSWLQVREDLNVGAYTFKKNNQPSTHKFSSSEMLSDLGVGMAGILGTEICYPNCSAGQKYKIVYRKIDLVNPFLNVDGTKRELNSRSNWFGWDDERSEVSKVIDAGIYEKEPEIVVTLTPSVIKEIRKYNDDSNNVGYNQTTSETFKYFKQKFPSIFEFKN